MNATPYVFHSYSILKEMSDDEVPTKQHLSIFKSVHKAPIAYRKLDPSEGDKDTMLVVLKSRQIKNNQVISFFISKRIAERKINIYHRIKDEFEEGLEGTSDSARAFIVVVPYLKKMAIQDKTGEHNINESSAISRLKKIIDEIAKHRMISEYAASAEQVRQAFTVWKIDEVTYSARPFNPHASTPGDILSAQMANNNSTISGRVKARKGILQDLKNGFIGELLGLSEKGYAEVGAKGKTDAGFIAQIGKSNLKEDVNEPMKIRVMMPERAEIEDHVSDIVDVMEQIYEPPS